MKKIDAFLVLLLMIMPCVSIAQDFSASLFKSGDMPLIVDQPKYLAFSAMRYPGITSGSNYILPANNLKRTTYIPGGKQDSDRDQPMRSFFIDFCGGMSSLYNKEIFKSSDWETKVDLAYQLSLGYQKRTSGFNHMLAFGMGIGFSSYGMKLNSTGNISRSIENQLDNSTDGVSYRNYTAHMNYTGISETTRLNYLSVPLYIEYGNQSTNKIGFFLKIGVSPYFNLGSSFDGSGNYTQTGYYPDYDLELPDLPGLFAFDTALYYGIKNYTLNKFIVTASISGGITIPLKNQKWIIVIGPRVETGLLALSNDSNNSDHNYWSNYNHILETKGSKAFIRNFGLEIGLHNVRSIF